MSANNLKTFAAMIKENKIKQSTVVPPNVCVVTRSQGALGPSGEGAREGATSLTFRDGNGMLSSTPRPYMNTFLQKSKSVQYPPTPMTAEGTMAEQVPTGDNPTPHSDQGSRVLGPSYGDPMNKFQMRERTGNVSLEEASESMEGESVRMRDTHNNGGFPYSTPQDALPPLYPDLAEFGALEGNGYMDMGGYQHSARDACPEEGRPEEKIGSNWDPPLAQTQPISHRDGRPHANRLTRNWLGDLPQQRGSRVANNRTADNRRGLEKTGDTVLQLGGEKKEKRSTSPDIPSIPNILAPEVFKGTDKEDAGVWINRFELYAKIKQWTEPQKATTMPLLLRDNAAIWYDSLPEKDKTSYAAIRAAFTTRYLHHPAFRWTLLEKFVNRKQGDKESAADYIQAMEKAGRDLKKGDSDIIDAVIQGLRPDISEFVMERMPNSLDSTLHFARLAESIKRRKPDNSQMQSSIHALQHQIAHLHTELSSEMATVKHDVNHIRSGPPPQWDRNSFEPRGRAPSGPGTQQAQDQNRPRFQPPQDRRNAPQVRQDQSYGNRPTPQPYGQRTDACWRCGGWYHPPSECKFRNAQCYRCYEIGHTANRCRRK